MKARSIAIVAALAAAAGIFAVKAPAATEKGTEAAPSAATEFQIDVAHSTVLFSARRMGVVNVYGRFNQLSGAFSVDEENVGNSSVNIEIRTESVDSGQPSRDNHLRNADFFNAVQFPVITFKSTAVERTGEKMFEVTGDLNLHGVTKSLTIPVEIIGRGSQRGRTMLGFESHFTIKRSEFGMNFMQGEVGISDEIKMILAIQGIGQR